MDKKAVYVGRRGFSNIFIGIIIAIIFVGAAGTFLVSKRTVVPENDRPSAEEELPVAQEKISSPLSPVENLVLPPTTGKKKETVTQGLGNLCFNEKECVSFCGNNREICEGYCRGKAINLCRVLFPPPSAQQLQEQSQAPIIKNLGVSFEPWDKNTNRAGAFIFLQTEEKLFLEYGLEVASSEGGTKILPTFEYYTAKDADVFAAIDGIITSISYKEQTQDYSIHIQPVPYSQWILGHDHVSSPKVSRGDTVKAGDILGKVGTWSTNGILSDTLGRTEILFWRSSPPLQASYCPFKYFDPQLSSEYQQKISRHMKDWEEFKSNPNIYNEGEHIFPGCIYESLVD